MPTCIASIIVLIVLLPALPPPDHQPSRTWIEILRKVDVLGTLLLTLSLATLFIALNWAGITYAWSDPRIVVLFVIFGILFAAFVGVQFWRGEDATLPLRVLRQRDVVAAAWFGFCIASALNVVEYYLPTYFQIVRGWTPAHSGWMMLPLIIATIIGTLIQGSGSVTSPPQPQKLKTYPSSQANSRFPQNNTLRILHPLHASLILPPSHRDWPPHHLLPP